MDLLRILHLLSTLSESLICTDYKMTRICWVALQNSLIVCTADLFDFLISLIYLVSFLFTIR